MKKNGSLQYRKAAEETEAYTTLHRLLPPIMTRSELLASVDEISAREYHKQRFSLPEPTMKDVREELLREADSGDISEMMRSGTAEDYADEYCEREYSSMHSQWENARQCFESTEQNVWEEQEQRKRSELEKLRLSLDAGESYIASQAERALSTLQLPYKLSASAAADADGIWIEALMPGAECIPNEQATAGGRSVRSKTPKERKLDYVRHVFSTAVYLAGKMFCISPKVRRTVLSMFESCRDRNGEQAYRCILSAVFRREMFEGVDWQSPDFSPQSFCEKSEIRFIVTPSGIMRKVKPFFAEKGQPHGRFTV